MSEARVHDDRPCGSGEGPLWHPDRGTLFWFDILGNALHCDDGRSWHFREPMSAAGWADRDTLIVAAAGAPWPFDLGSGARDRFVALDTDHPATRSNDGRADPWAEFWIGTMGREAESGLRAIYLYHRDSLRKNVEGLTISNAICFAPYRSCAYYTSTARGVVLRLALARYSRVSTGSFWLGHARCLKRPVRPSACRTSTFSTSPQRPTGLIKA